MILNKKFNTNQCDFFEAKSVLLPCLDFISPPVSSQRQIDSIYFNLSSTSDLALRTVLLTKLL